jgi:beta-lactamase class A
MIAAEDLAALAGDAGLLPGTIVLLPLDGAGPPAVHDPDRPIYPASMIKTPLAIAALAAVAAGNARLDEPIATRAANMTFNDAPSPLEPGYRATLEELLGLMLRFSDNVATNVLFDRLGREAASHAIAALGFPGTAFRRKLSGSLPLIDDPEATGRNTHPAVEAAALFARIAIGAVPGAERVHALLHEQYWNDKLSAGLAPGDRFAHKTGDTDEVSHDGGILELAGGPRYVLVVYTERASDAATDARFAAFMRAARPLLAAG